MVSPPITCRAMDAGLKGIVVLEGGQSISAESPGAEVPVVQRDKTAPGVVSLALDRYGRALGRLVDSQEAVA
jgi:hypothetical protein